jgi:antitoxin ParD1/3/4
MNVSLTDELEHWIEGRVSAGLYRSSSEVVREAIRLLREQEEMKELHREELRRSIKAGIDDLDSGRSRPLDSTTGDRIKAAGRRRASPTK